MQATKIPVRHSRNWKQSIGNSEQIMKPLFFSTFTGLQTEVSQICLRLLKKNPLKALVLENTDHLFQ